jgi:hypothetical protein
MVRASDGAHLSSTHVPHHGIGRAGQKSREEMLTWHERIDAVAKRCTITSAIAYRMANDLPQSGQVGIYAVGTGGPTTFSDLLLSPA